MKSKFILLCLLPILAGYAFWWRWESHSKNEALPPTTSSQGDSRRLPGTIARIEKAKADPRLTPVFADPLVSQDLSVLKALLPVDETVLLEAYQQTTNLLERNSLTWALAFAGSNATVAAFKHTLTDEYKGRQMTVNEARMMYSMVEALGMMSWRNEAAFALLKEGTDPWFWQRSVGWKSHNGPDDYGMLTSRSITGVAMSGRKDVPEILEALSKQPLENSPDPRNWKRTFNSEVVIAAFQHAQIRDRGREVFLEWFFTPFDDSFQTDGGFSKWSATTEGKKWKEWSDKFDEENLAHRKAANRWP